MLNQTPQLVLGIHNFAGAHDRCLPDVDGPGSVFTAILPYVDRQPIGDTKSNDTPSPLYRSPADPRYALMTPQNIDPNKLPTRGNGNISYGVNALICRATMRLDQIGDGTSNTILVSERMRCAGKVMWVGPRVSAS